MGGVVACSCRCQSQQEFSAAAPGPRRYAGQAAQVERLVEASRPVGSRVHRVAAAVWGQPAAGRARIRLPSHARRARHGLSFSVPSATRPSDRGRQALWRPASRRTRGCAGPGGGGFFCGSARQLGPCAGAHWLVLASR